MGTIKSFPHTSTVGFVPFDSQQLFSSIRYSTENIRTVKARLAQPYSGGPKLIYSAIIMCFSNTGLYQCRPKLFAFP